MPVSIAIVDDHRVVAESISDMLQKHSEYEVVCIAANGHEFLKWLRFGKQPDLVLLDLIMPEMDGFETARQLRELYPAMRILALSMDDREERIIRMIRNGAQGYLLKGCRTSELRQAIDDVMRNGMYSSDFLTKQLMRSIHKPEDGSKSGVFRLNERESEFLKLSCSDLTYNEIADRMCLSPRTIDGYRETVFQKMGVRTRTTMALAAIKYGLVELS